MSSYKLVNKTSQETFASLHQRICQNAPDLSRVFSPEVFGFVEGMAQSIGVNTGYVAISILTAVNYKLSSKATKIQVTPSYYEPLNTYAIVVGPPSTGKTPAFHNCVKKHLLQDGIIDKSTLSGLTKLLAKEGKAFLVNSEVKEFLHSLLQNDEVNASGDVQLLCKLFSGELAQYNFATENARSLSEDTSFSILGEFSFFIYIIFL